jgi:transglutaminase-like putative cysteine protease
MLRPRSGVAQWLCSERLSFEPPLHPTEYVDGFGNLCQRFVVPEGRLRVRVQATVDTDDAIAVDPMAPITRVEALPADALQFLLQSRYCPSDRMRGLAAEIVASACAAHAPGAMPGYAQVEAIRAWIRQNIAYRYGASNETTDALNTLNDRAGVCRDFAHVGIAMCRSLYIPARMVVGYMHQLDPMDLHAWFEAFLGGRWYTFDATQDRPRGGRIVVAYGRDAADVAFVSNFGELQTLELKVWVALDTRVL